jgi:hypothetical protein
MIQVRSRAGRHLCREAGLAGALLVLPRRRVDVGPAEARGLRHDTNSRFVGDPRRRNLRVLCYLEDAVELVGGVVVEEEGQPRPDRPHGVPVPRRQSCNIRISAKKN